MLKTFGNIYWRIRVRSRILGANCGSVLDGPRIFISINQISKNQNQVISNLL